MNDSVMQSSIHILHTASCSNGCYCNTEENCTV